MSKAVVIYTFTVSGTDSVGKGWQTQTKHPVDGVPDFEKIFARGMAESFAMLTGGKAVFGEPGIGCTGPYDITKIVIEQLH